MDGHRFDQLARAFADRSSRRRLLKVAVGFGGAAVAGAVRTPETAACSAPGVACSRSRDCCEGRCTGGVCVCPGSTTACNGACIRTERDPANCGACGNACAPGQTCRNGVCTCPGQTVLCNGVCVNPRTDEANCGGCGITCTASSPCKEAICRQGSCRELNRPNGTLCDDGNACTQTDTCQNGVCASRNPVVCTALDQCHDAGACDPTTGLCSHPNKPNGASCNDGNPCTTGDACRNGVCTGGQALACASDNPCLTAACDPIEGCVEAPVGPGIACGDDSPCNGGEVCDGAGNCVAGTPVRCDPCNRCDPDTGSCVPWDDGLPCPGDGDLCFGRFICQAGTCVGIDPVTCTAQDQCHDAGVCDPKTGKCSNPDKPNGAACDDANACTRTDTCQAGVCTGADPVLCTALDSCHEPGTCDPATGLCSNPAKPDGAPCDDANACTQGGSCQAGSCNGSNPISCPTPDDCHDAGTCNPATGLCSDAVLKPGYCTIGGACVAAGQSALDNPCLVCDPSRSSTSWSPAVDGTRCSDSNACTDTDTCQHGLCTPGTEVSCTPGPCQLSGACNQVTGACEYVDAPDGTLCEDDGNLCTIDICVAGACTHPPKSCDDLDPCTIDTCDPETGDCSNEPLDCDDDNVCTIDSCVEGQCVHEPIECEEGDACVSYSCDPEFGCSPEVLDCADGNLCTSDSCDPELGCVYEEIECGDGAPCDSVGCDPDAGCVYTPKECPAGHELDLDTCECKERCTSEQTQCGDSCTDLKSDDNNCGRCGNVCTPGPDGCSTFCINGRCDWKAMACQPSGTEPGINAAACCEGLSCCIGTQTACCLRSDHICWFEGGGNSLAHCTPG